MPFLDFSNARTAKFSLAPHVQLLGFSMTSPDIIKPMVLVILNRESFQDPLACFGEDAMERC